MKGARTVSPQSLSSGGGVIGNPPGCYGYGGLDRVILLLGGLERGGEDLRENSLNFISIISFPLEARWQ